MYRDKLCFIVIAVFYTSICCIVPTLGDHEQCLDGPYHKDKPSKESDAFKFCTPWKNLTCCNVKLDNEISLDNAPKKYNDTWHLCGNLSTNCLMHWKRQECFYQCSPYVYKWRHNEYKEAITGVPICASECDAWYEACKSDLICVENVLEDYNRTVNYLQECPAGKTCVNYTVMYGSGENMCTKMWGTSYKYVKKNGDNCMKFWFTPGLENPNANVLKDGGIMPCSAFSNKLLVAVILAMKAFLS